LLGSIGRVLLLAILLGQALGLPEVEDPIPDKIGLGHLIALAGAGGVLGGLVKVKAPPAKRERAISWGTMAGFCLGVALYCLALIVEVISGL
jgi:hypothetical protein